MEIVVGRTIFTSGHRTVGKNMEEVMAEDKDRHIWRLVMDRPLLAV